MKRTGNIVRMAVLCVLSVICLGPLIFAAYSSLQFPQDYGNWSGFHLTFENYTRVLEIAPLLRWYFNTFIVVVSIVVGNLLVNSMAGYALARLKFPGSKIIFSLIMVMMIVPLQAFLVPMYIWVSHWNWLNSFKGLIIPFLVLPFYIFMMRQFFTTIPKELEDAAMIDGLGLFGTFFRVILPISKPMLATQAILCFTSTWNSFLIPVTLVNDNKYFMITVGLNTLKDLNFDWPTVTMAGVMYLTVPVIIVFIFLQKYIIQGIATSGLKG